MNRTHKSGFTLVEILVTMGVVAALGAITVSAVGAVKNSAHKAGDVSAARQLVTAFMMYPQDNGGRMMPAQPSQNDQQLKVVYDHNGAAIMVPAVANRYVYRLLPYTDSLDAMYPGQSQGHLREMMEDGNVYDISLYPSFGFNSDFVGGNYEGGRYSVDRDPRVAITNMSQCVKPSEQIVFISTHTTGVTDESPYSGHYRAGAPNALRSSNSWKGSYNEEIPANMGNIHLRYNNQAVVAHLDGSVAMLTEEELEDMRRWSNEARDQNDPNFNPR